MSWSSKDQQLFPPNRCRHTCYIILNPLIPWAWWYESHPSLEEWSLMYANASQTLLSNINRTNVCSTLTLLFRERGPFVRCSIFQGPSSCKQGTLALLRSPVRMQAISGHVQRIASRIRLSALLIGRLVQHVPSKELCSQTQTRGYKH